MLLGAPAGFAKQPVMLVEAVDDGAGDVEGDLRGQQFREMGDGVHGGVHPAMWAVFAADAGSAGGAGCAGPAAAGAKRGRRLPSVARSTPMPPQTMNSCL